MDTNEIRALIKEAREEFPDDIRQASEDKARSRLERREG